MASTAPLSTSAASDGDSSVPASVSARKVPKKVRKFVSKHEDLEIVEATGKVHCAPTNYDMLPKLEDIKAHLAGSKYVNTACLFFFAVSYTTYHSHC